jgi:hypothetical protein
LALPFLPVREGAQSFCVSSLHITFAWINNILKVKDHEIDLIKIWHFQCSLGISNKRNYCTGSFNIIDSCNGALKIAHKHYFTIHA